MKRLGLMIGCIVFLIVLSACDTQNTTCPNGTGFMWTSDIHCIAGSEYTTPSP